MVIDRIKHTKPASERTFLDELEPIPYEITEEELAKMDPRMRKILFGYEEGGAEAEGTEAPEEETPPQSEAAKEEVAKAEEAESPEPVEEEPEPFDPTPVADFPPAEGRTITLIFAAGEGDEEAEALARAAAEHREAELEGRRWHAVRYAAAGAGELKQLNELLGEREDVVVLVDGKRPPYGRSLWLPLMYIFTAASEE